MKTFKILFLTLSLVLLSTIHVANGDIFDDSDESGALADMFDGDMATQQPGTDLEPQEMVGLEHSVHRMELLFENIIFRRTITSVMRRLASIVRSPFGMNMIKNVSSNIRKVCVAKNGRESVLNFLNGLKAILADKRVNEPLLQVKEGAKLVSESQGFLNVLKLKNKLYGNILSADDVHLLSNGVVNLLTVAHRRFPQLENPSKLVEKIFGWVTWFIDATGRSTIVSQVSGSLKRAARSAGDNTHFAVVGNQQGVTLNV